ncbi:MAG: MBL fold metallo-hydrolase [Gemmatimonadaceae bacterium]
MRITSHTVGPFAENCYLVVDERTNSAVLVDPGAEEERILRALKVSGATLEAIWLTHAHIDHVGAIAAVRRAYDVPIYLHPADRPLYDNASWQAAQYGLPFDAPPPPDRDLADGDLLQVGDEEFKVIHTPGHAPGHCVFESNGLILAGDLLFAGSIGRTDLPLCDPRAMTESLARISALEPALVVRPGHGPSTTIGRELETNPFLNGIAGVVRG